MVSHGVTPLRASGEPVRCKYLLPCLRLCRVSFALTAAADVLSGYFLAMPSGAGWDYLDPLGLAFISVLIYACGMAMNSVMDMERDRALYPERVLPSGGLTLGQAAALMSALIVLASWRAFLFGPQVVAALGWLLLCVVLYNAVLKRFACLGALGMGLCRLCNVLLGMSVHGVGVLHAPPSADLLVFPCILAGYVTALTVWSLAEEADRQWPYLAAGGTGLLVCVVALAVWAGWYHEVNMLPLIALALWMGPRLGRTIALSRSARRIMPGRLEAIVGDTLLGIFLLDSAVLLRLGHDVAAMLVAAMIAPSVWMRQRGWAE